MKKLLFIFFYLIVSVAQGAEQHQEQQLTISQENPHIILDKDTIILVHPSEETIDELKAKMGDDFYTIADDANYAVLEINDYLTLNDQTYLNVQDNTVISYLQKEGKLHIIKNDTPHLYWWAVVYKGDEKTYRIIALVNFKYEYQQFMGITYPDKVFGDCPGPYTKYYKKIGIIHEKGCIGMFNGEEVALGTWYEYDEAKNLIRTVSFYPNDTTQGYRIIREYDRSGKISSEKIIDNNRLYQKELKKVPAIKSDQQQKIEMHYSEIVASVWQDCPKPYVEYYKNHTIKTRGCQGSFHTMGTPLGTLYEYDESGKLIRSTYYHRDEFGKDYKIVKLYDKSGNVISEKIFNDDDLYETEEKELKEIPK